MLRNVSPVLCAVLCLLCVHALAFASDPFVAVEAEIAATKAFPATSSPSPLTPRIDPFDRSRQDFEERVNYVLANRPAGEGWKWDEKTQSYWRYSQSPQQPAPVAFGGYRPAYAPVGSYGYMGAGFYTGDDGMMVCGPNGCGPASFGASMMMAGAPMMAGAGVCGPGGCGPSGGGGRVAFRRR